MTLRLTAGMYHRFHAPADGTVEHVTYISGDTWNVNPIALKRVERLFWAGNVRMPDTVLQQINARIANEQHALAAQAQVATVQAEAQQRIAAAEGEAKAIQVQGDSLRTNPEVLRLRAIEKWDGHMPQVTSGATPFIEVGKP